MPLNLAMLVAAMSIMIDYFSTTTPMHDIISVIYEEYFNYYITVNYKLYLVYVTGMKKLISTCCIDTNGLDVINYMYNSTQCTMNYSDVSYTAKKNQLK